MDDMFSPQQQAPDQGIREQLNKMFSRRDFVGVKNTLKKKFVWAVALEENEFVGMSPADPMNEESMAQRGGSTFLPGDGAVRQQQKITRYELEPGERKMILGEAAYVIAEKIFKQMVREKYGTDKQSLARLRNPSTQKELLKDIIAGPIVNNVEGAMQTYVNDKLAKIEDAGFTDVQTTPTQKAKSGAKSA